MKIPREYEGSRLNMRRTAELLSMDDGHLRRLVRRGVFPSPRRTSKGLPYYDFELLSAIGGILKSGVGISGEEVSFYRRRRKKKQSSDRRNGRSRGASVDEYLRSLIEGCRQLGVGEEVLDASHVAGVVREAFGNDRPELEQALPEVVRLLLAGE